jgi:hypothetical protein
VLLGLLQFGGAPGQAFFFPFKLGQELGVRCFPLIEGGEPAGQIPKDLGGSSQGIGRQACRGGCIPLGGDGPEIGSGGALGLGVGLLQML